MANSNQINLRMWHILINLWREGGVKNSDLRKKFVDSKILPGGTYRRFINELKNKEGLIGIKSEIYFLTPKGREVIDKNKNEILKAITFEEEFEVLYSNEKYIVIFINELNKNGIELVLENLQKANIASLVVIGGEDT